MSNFINGASAINTYTVAAADGFQDCTPAGGYLQMTSSGTATVQVKTPLALNGLTTGDQSAEDAWRKTVGTTAFWNAGATNLITDLDAITLPSDVATGTHTGLTSRNLTGGGTGSGAVFTAVCVQAAGTCTITSLTVTDHGDGYRLGDRLAIAVTDGTNTTEYIITFQDDTSGAVLYGWKTEDTTTSFASVGVVSSQYGSGAVGTITVAHTAATTNGDAFSTLTDIAFTTAGELYQSGEQVTMTIGFSDGDVDTFHNITVGKGFSNTLQTEMTSGQFLPFIITEFKNMETSDDTFILVV